MEKLQIIIPVTDRDYGRVKRDLGQMLDFLDAREIIFIGPAALGELVNRDASGLAGSGTIRFLNENEIIEFDILGRVMARRLAMDGYTMNADSRPGWYYQQFLKMAFCSLCDGDCYMSWDADTLPIRPVTMFNENGQPFFDIKNEYQPSYFRTIKKLFGLDKIIEKSFISEHMLFNKNRMAEMITEVESLDGPGEWFYEKIFYSLDIDNMLRGFSEFETYGTFVMSRYPGEYVLRDWRSMRIAGAFMKPDAVEKEDLDYLAADFDSVTFESYHPYSPDLAAFFKNPAYRSKVSPGQFYNIVLESGFFGDMQDGALAVDGTLVPV